jgi:hypothetical protein
VGARGGGRGPGGRPVSTSSPRLRASCARHLPLSRGAASGSAPPRTSQTLPLPPSLDPRPSPPPPRLQLPRRHLPAPPPPPDPGLPAGGARQPLPPGPIRRHRARRQALGAGRRGRGGGARVARGAAERRGEGAGAAGGGRPCWEELAATLPAPWHARAAPRR